MDRSAHELDRDALRLLRDILDTEPTARGPLLDIHCAGDTALRQRVQKLLSRVDEAETHSQNIHDLSNDPAGERLGPWRLLRRLGHGGMGEVFLAERADGAFEREVAIKRIRAGFAPLAERFLRERHILARLQHPHIAQLLDGGLDAQGHPWFALEYVRGEPITHWCDAQCASVETRVALLRELCGAVQFAHSNLIVHRDIKPANVLVAADAQPKLLDFGIAKLLGDADATQTQLLAMTPAWAAPEQRRGEAPTTATDVYQLGLLLRDLLLGDVTGRSVDATASPRLSTAYATQLRTHPAAAQALAAARGCTPERLTAQLRGDLERIVSKATAEDARERYASAEALGEDLGRWQQHRPLQAQPGAWSYRAGKFLRRHRAAAALVATLAFALVAAGGFAWQRLQAERAQFRRAEATAAFLRDIFVASTPDETDGAKLTAEQLLANAAARLPKQFRDDPITGAYLEGELGEVYSELGRFEQADAHLQRAMTVLRPYRDEHALAYLDALVDQVITRNGQAEPEEALALLDAEQSFIEAHLPRPHVLRARSDIARGHALALLGRLPEAETALNRAVGDYRAAGEPPSSDQLAATATLASVYVRQGKLERGLALYRQALQAAAAYGVQKHGRLALAYGVASTQQQLGQYAEAIAGYTELLPQFERHLGADHPRTGVVRIALVLAYAADGQFGPAFAQLVRQRQVLATANEPTPDRFAEVDWVEAKVAAQALRPEDSLQLARHASRFFEGKYPQATTARARARAILAEALLQTRALDEAERMFTAALEDSHALNGDAPHPFRIRALDGLARCRLQRGDLDGARVRFAQALDTARASDDRSGRLVLRARIHLLWAEALLYRDPHRVEQLAALRQPLAHALRRPDHPVLWQFDRLHGELAAELGSPPPAASRLRAAAAGLQRLAGTATTPQPVGLLGVD